MHVRAGPVHLAAVLLLGTGCGSDARLSVSAVALSPTLNTAEVRYRIVAGDRNWAVTLPSPAGDRHSQEFDTPKSGTGRVSFAVKMPDGREVGAGEVTVPLRDDWAWDFDLSAKTEDPRRTCFGCVGSKAFALRQEFRETGRDSLWLVWGGNSIKHPVVY